SHSAPSRRFAGQRASRVRLTKPKTAGSACRKAHREVSQKRKPAQVYEVKHPSPDPQAPCPAPELFSFVSFTAAVSNKKECHGEQGSNRRRAHREVRELDRRTAHRVPRAHRGGAQAAAPLHR